jgi:hypothetical protein
MRVTERHVSRETQGYFSGTGSVPTDRQTLYTRNRCFFCGKLVKDKNSREHVFPKWLQEKFDLWDKTITLLNHTRIQYSKLTVPCCERCNTVHLSQLENRVNRLLFASPISLARKESHDIWIWAMKILLGIVYAERLFPLQRSKPAGRRIFPAELRDMLTMTHFFVRGLDLDITFEAEGVYRPPGSIFVFNLKTHSDVHVQFDFRDDIRTLIVFLRLGNRGIIAAADGGALDFELGPLVRRDAAIKLHPVQFDEIGAKLFYKATLFNRTPKYITMHTGKSYKVMQMPLQGLSPKPVFDEWDHGIYAHYLAQFMNTTVDRISSPDRSLVSTWLYDKDGNRVHIPIDAT